MKTLSFFTFCVILQWVRIMRRLTKEYEIGKGAIHSSRKNYSRECSVHSHEFFEIEYFSAGHGEHIMDGVRSEIKEGMLYFMTPLNFHSFNAEDCVIYNTMFSEKICNTAFLLGLIRNNEGLSIRLEGEDKIFVEALLSELCEHHKNEEYASFLLNAVLCKLALIKNCNDAEMSTLSRALVYLIEHFRENPTLNDTAAYAGFTPTYFSALFKKEINIGFKEYVDRLRFEYAKKLLEHTDKTVMQVCSESGFDDYPNFVRRFKKRYGVAPGSMKKQNVQNKIL